MTVKYVEQLSDTELLDLYKKCVDNTAIKIASKQPWKQVGSKVINYLVFIIHKDNTAKGYVYSDFYAPYLPYIDFDNVDILHKDYRTFMTRRFGLPYALDLLEEVTYVSRNDIRNIDNKQIINDTQNSLKSILTRGKK